MNNFTSVKPATDLLSLVRDDANDTMKKMANYIPLLVDISTAELGDVIDMVEVPIGPFTVGDAAGNIYNFEVTATEITNGSNVIANINTEGLMELTSMIAVSTESISVTLDDLCENILDTYSCNDVMSRITTVAINEEVSTSAFSAACTDIIANCSGQAKSLYQTLLNSASAGSLSGVLQVIASQYISIRDAVVEDGVIKFADNDYVVKDYAMTITSAVDSATTFLAKIGAYVVKITEIAFDFIGSIFNWVVSKVNEAGEANLNYNSKWRMMAQPLFQQTYSNISTAPFVDDLKNAVREFGAIKISLLFVDMFMWATARNSSGEVTSMACECFASCGFESILKAGEVEDGVDFMSFTHDSNDYIAAIKILNTSTRAIYYSDSISKIGSNFSSREYSDDEIRDSLLATIVQFGFMAQNYVGDITMRQERSYTPTSTGNFYRNFMWYAGRRAADGIIPSWSEIVNILIPSLQNNPGWFLNLFNDAIAATPYSVWGPYLSFRLNEFPVKNDFFITPPNYTGLAMILFGITAALAVVLLGASFAGIRSLIRRRTLRRFTRRKASFNTAEAAYLMSPSQENLDTLYKTSRKYIRMSNKLGMCTLYPSTVASNGNLTALAIVNYLNGVKTLIK